MRGDLFLNSNPDSQGCAAWGLMLVVMGKNDLYTAPSQISPPEPSLAELVWITLWFQGPSRGHNTRDWSPFCLFVYEYKSLSSESPHQWKLDCQWIIPLFSPLSPFIPPLGVTHIVDSVLCSCASLKGSEWDPVPCPAWVFCRGGGRGALKGTLGSTQCQQWIYSSWGQGQVTSLSWNRDLILLLFV